MMREFRVNNSEKWPEQIIFCRDGVSEGQFQSVSCCGVSPEEMTAHTAFLYRMC